MKINFKFWISIIICIGLLFETNNSKSDKQEEYIINDVYGYLNDFSEIKIEPYIYLVETENRISIQDSLLIFDYTIKNLDSINYYIPMLGIGFGGNRSDSWSLMCHYSEHWNFMCHTINYYPVGAKIQCEFDMPLLQSFDSIPFFHLIKPDDALILKVVLSKYLYNPGGVYKYFNEEADYTFLTKFSIINENILLSMINAFNLKHHSEQLIINKLFVEIKNRYPDIGDLNVFPKSNVPIDSASSEKLNYYFIHHIKIFGELKKEQITY